MPLTSTGRRVLANMRKQYGDRAESIFYASIKKGVAGSKKWHKKRRKKKRGYSRDIVKMALAKKGR